MFHKISILAAVLVLSPGCALTAGAAVMGGSALLSKKAQDDREAQARLEQQRYQEEQRKRDAEAATAAAERQRKLDAAKERAKTPQKLAVVELGVQITVPGDIEYKDHHTKDYGDPAKLLTGEGSGFKVILTDASLDRYGLYERTRAQMSEYTYGIDIIRSEEKKGGSWDLEFSYPIYYTSGDRGPTMYGLFARRVVGGKKINCFISGLDGAIEVGKVIQACDSLEVAGTKTASR